MSGIGDIIQLAGLASGGGFNLNPLVENISSKIGADATQVRGEAIETIKSCGEKPSDWIALSRSELRQRQVLATLKAEKRRAKQERKAEERRAQQEFEHRQRMLNLEFTEAQTKAQYNAQLARDLSKRGQQRPKPQQLPFPVPPKVQAPKPMPPVPQPPAQP